MIAVVKGIFHTKAGKVEWQVPNQRFGTNVAKSKAAGCLAAIELLSNHQSRQFHCDLNQSCCRRRSFVGHIFTQLLYILSNLKAHKHHVLRPQAATAVICPAVYDHIVWEGLGRFWVWVGGEEQRFVLLCPMFEINIPRNCFLSTDGCRV